ncbi:hypothetical protein HMPREF9318_01380 [Streptococcus urinalis FB127-CNA-2]|uniref:D-ribose pyranase n=1 Tax=Streptococcus urinalis 2285-97 TaxID=764291 RepID=G5KD41_9STRE|nr:D-ribose pyranase [Streptococcus urinalis]EHJ55817.1 RbsD/FucU transport family protein [Streptococcus urinalis 2285-97]EKS19304.1 hypothetical protein HMPREF9318_01380 [Streptococcus urinalis FB127-CNA-2]VEF31435.1 high affinity ribose transport protein RbsD [Streptococcus urinalis]
MKKNGLLNSQLSKVVDDLGHTDLIAIGDLGLPVPKDIKKIDLALKIGSPSFKEVLEEYLTHVLVEKVYLAEEIKSQNPQQLETIKELLGDTISIEFMTHETLKEKTKEVKAVVRTGEDTAYSNIILQSGVII